MQYVCLMFYYFKNPKEQRRTYRIECNVCAVHWGLCSALQVYHQCIGACSVHWDDIISALGDIISALGDIISVLGGYNQCIWAISSVHCG